VWAASPAQVLAAAFYVGSTGRGLRVQFEPGNESPAGAFITGMVLRVADLLARVDLSRVKRSVRTIHVSGTTLIRMATAEF
jgi:hypothetical protein